jgi:hypothetical protein
MNEANQESLQKKMNVLDPKLNTLGTMRLMDDQLEQEEAEKIKLFLQNHVDKIFAHLDWLVKNPQKKGAKVKEEAETFSF